MRGFSCIAVVSLVAGACTHHKSMTEIGDPNDPDRELKIEEADGYGNASRVTEIKRGRGALEGFGIGALVGAGTGIVIGVASGSDTPCDSGDHRCIDFSAADKAMLLGIALGGVGALGGLIYGAVTGSTYIYTADSGTVRVRSSGPPGSVMGVTVTF